MFGGLLDQALPDTGCLSQYFRFQCARRNCPCPLGQGGSELAVGAVGRDCGTGAQGAPLHPPRAPLLHSCPETAAKARASEQQLQYRLPVHSLTATCLFTQLQYSGQGYGNTSRSCEGH